MPTAGLRVPASNPAASPSSRRGKLKGRFMLSDPWGGGRLCARIEAWHGSARLRSRHLSRVGLPRPVLRSCLAATRPRAVWRERGTCRLGGRWGDSGGAGSVPRVPKAGLGPAVAVAGGDGAKPARGGLRWPWLPLPSQTHKSCGSCRGDAAPAPLRQNGAGSASSPGTPRPWHLTPSSLRGQGRGGWQGVPVSPPLSSSGPLPVPILPTAPPGDGLPCPGPARAVPAQCPCGAGDGRCRRWVEGRQGLGAVVVPAGTPGAAGVCRAEPGSAGPPGRAGWGRAGAGARIRAGPSSGRLRRYIRAGAEAAVARRCHGNQHGDVVGRVPGGEARPLWAPLSRWGPRASPGCKHSPQGAAQSCSVPVGGMGSGLPWSCALVPVVLGMSPAISLQGILIFIVDISHAHSPWSHMWVRATVSRQWTTCAAAVT